MLLKHLYELSLEGPVGWAMFVGFATRETKPESLRADMLASYLYGLGDAAGLAGNKLEDLSDFWSWLETEKHELPTGGQPWYEKFLDDCGNSDSEAVKKYFRLLQEYVLHSRPAWFFELNSAPLPSKIRNGGGRPRIADMRLPDHVAVACASSSS